MKDGLASICRECKKAVDKAYREQNKESIAKAKAKCYQEKKAQYNAKTSKWVKDNPEGRKAISDRYYRNNRERILDYLAGYREQNREICQQRSKAWAERNPERVRAKDAKRRSAKINALPKWLTEDQLEQIVQIYAHAKECEMLTGDKYHVDHIVPLQGKNVCGLHVPWNLQVLPADINQSKSNKLDDSAFYSQGFAGI
jgi:hypothetical protein